MVIDKLSPQKTISIRESILGHHYNKLKSKDQITDETLKALGYRPRIPEDLNEYHKIAEESIKRDRALSQFKVTQQDYLSKFVKDRLVKTKDGPDYSQVNLSCNPIDEALEIQEEETQPRKVTGLP